MQTGSMCWSEASATSNRNAVFRVLDQIENDEGQKAQKYKKRLTPQRKKQFHDAFSSIRGDTKTGNTSIQPSLAQSDDVFLSEVHHHLYSIIVEFNTTFFTGSKTRVEKV